MPEADLGNFELAFEEQRRQVQWYLLLGTDWESGAVSS